MSAARSQAQESGVYEGERRLPSDSCGYTLTK